MSAPETARPRSLYESKVGFMLPPSPRGIPYLGHRYIYDTCAGRPLKNDLVAQLGADRETSPIWCGRGEIEFFDAENEEVCQFRPRRMVGAWWYHSRYRSGRNVSQVVHDFGDVNPYAERGARG